MRHGHPLNAARRRMRKEQLARRHGQRCAYCLRPFADLREATLDHIAPQSLWRSWSVTSLLLACADCNQIKADRLPLSLALVLCATFNPTGVNAPSTPVDPTMTFIDGTVDVVDASVTPVDRPCDALALWRLLAQLAAAHETALTCVTARVTAVSTGVTPDLDARRPADPTGERSTPTLHRSTRPGCLRTPRPVRSCTGSTGEAVCA